MSRPAAPRVELRVVQAGAGEDVVLLCGLGDTPAAWGHQLASLAVDHRVSALENRGTGQTPAPPGPWTLADQAADAASALDTRGIARAHVVGFSMGGAIAQELGLARPDLCRTLTLVGSWARTDARQRALFESWRWMAAVAPDDEAFLRAAWAWVYSDRAHADGRVDAWVQAALAEAGQPLDAFTRAVDAVLGHDTADRLGALSVPALVLAGTEDRVCPPAVQAALRAAIPGAELVLLDGEAHQPFQESPEPFDAVLRDFWARRG